MFPFDREDDKFMTVKIQVITNDFIEQLTPIEISESICMGNLIDKLYTTANLVFQLRPEVDAVKFSYDGFIYTITPDLMKENDEASVETYKEEYLGDS